MANPWANDDSIANFNAFRERKRNKKPSQLPAAFLGTGFVALLLATVAAWITHVIVCIKASAWILLAFGCIVAPVGVIHGVGVWLGLF